MTFAGDLTARIVAAVLEHGPRPVRPRDLAEQLGASKHTVASLLAQQVNAGLVVRVSRGEYVHRDAAAECELDDVVLERLCSVAWPSPPEATRAEVLEAVRRMAARRFSDYEIARRLQTMTASGVQQLREREGIPVGRDVDVDELVAS